MFSLDSLLISSLLKIRERVISRYLGMFSLDGSVEGYDGDYNVISRYLGMFSLDSVLDKYLQKL